MRRSPLPIANGVSVPARHAYSHSASVGNRYAHPFFIHGLPLSFSPSFLQNSFASAQVTESTGMLLKLCASFAERDGVTLITATYCALVTSVADMKNGPLIVTSRTGPSRPSAARASSLS